jgi:hypothetical protein
VEQVARLDPRRRFLRDEATHLLWVCYGLTQAVLAVLLGFGVITSTDPSAAVTAVALILYVALNELVVRPARRGASKPGP